MGIASLILVQTSLAGNLGAAMRVAANFGVPRIDLVRPLVDPSDSEVARWACGADELVELRRFDCLAEAAHEYRTLIASASGRGRHKLPVVSPSEVVPIVLQRGLEGTAMVFGNESSGLQKEDLDRCDLVVRVPTQPEFPVLNLAQAIAILVAQIQAESGPAPNSAPQPASQQQVEGLMEHLQSSLSIIGFLDPWSPQRILRKLRRLFGRAGITENEVTILRGMCRQMEWAAGAKPGRFADNGSAASKERPK
jgi:TrmH family RNA methyltransferase